MTEKGYISDMYKQLEEIMNKCNSLSQQVKTIKKDTERKYKEEIKKIKQQHKIQLDKLNNEIKELKQENSILKNEVDRLKKQINNNSNNSNNSSKPPSSDIKPNKKDIPNNREKSGKKVGGQVGHKGVHLSKKYVEENIKNNNFNHIIKHVGNVSDKYISKYVLDISVEVNATEYRFYANENGKIVIPKEFQTDVQYGSELKTLCTVLNVNNVVAIDRLTDFVSHITHGKINMSNGTIVNHINKLSFNLDKILNNVKDKILNSSKMNTDATTCRCNNKNISVRNYSTDNYTLLCATNGKSKADLEETGILSQYIGALIHDHETVMYNYGSKHVECNVHVTRYLKGNHENTSHSWNIEMIDFLNNLNNKKKELILNNINNFTKDELDYYLNKYDEIIAKAKEENKKEKSAYYKAEERSLINRLEKYKENHLMFILDFGMPFDNNMSERELRHVKLKQKVSGFFNSLEGAQNYLNIKSFILCCQKQGEDFYKLIKNIFDNEAVIIL